MNEELTDGEPLAGMLVECVVDGVCETERVNESVPVALLDDDAVDDALAEKEDEEDALPEEDGGSERETDKLDV